MNDKIPLHWSFNYNHGSQKPEYTQNLIKLLQRYEAGEINAVTGEYKKHVYQILPNYWRGYNNDKSFNIGQVVIERNKKNGDNWIYNVNYINETNGEDLQYQFNCCDEMYRPLDGNWHVDVQNSCPDAYSKLSWDGNLTSDTEIQLGISNRKIKAAKVDNSLPITCNWALFDVFPALVDNKKKIEDAVEIALLDDLEHLRPKCRIGYLDTIEFPITLDGYYLYGTGSLPSYWWVDVYGNTVIVSSVFETLVLKEIIGGTP